MKKRKICLSCLHMIEATEKGCPFCGFDPDHVTDKKLLPAGILLYHRYYIGKVLGEGGFGITYTGYDTSEKRPVAIKEYFPANIAQRNISQENPYAVIPFDGDNGNVFEHGRERFAQEAKVLKKLTNLSHVVKVYDYFLQNNTGYLIMEYVPGMTLREHVKEKGVFTIEQMYDVIGPIVNDLAKIHEMGIVHRDISPDNIILQANGVAKVIDFGTARTVMQKEDGTNKTMTVMLRQQYAPKEQYLPNGHVGAWSDIYSLCATIYFMLFGKDPENVFEREAKDVANEFRENELSDAQKLLHVLEKGMSVDCKKRYQTMSELQKALKEAITGKRVGKQSQNHTIYIDREQNGKKYMSLSKKKTIFKIVSVLILGVCLLGASGYMLHLHTKKKAVSQDQTVKPASLQKKQNGQAQKESKKESDTKSDAQQSQLSASDRTQTGTKLVIVPDVCKKTYQEAGQLLHNTDPALLIVVEKKHDPTVKKGRVISQSLKAGKSYQKNTGTEIVLTVSKGKRQETKANVSATVSPKPVRRQSVSTLTPKKTSRPHKTKAPKKNIKIITQD